ncbi:MAG: hypothetical protein KBA81_04170 [Rhabdochlamydiaceae bacterium]|nr:hypothetical protein [Rhabdochlamydiaceae bacterium]
MDLLTFAQNDGLNPKRVASTNGGEYHSPCPGCGGHDRFIIWDKKDRYYCRKCQKSGDLIQYLRDFHALSFNEACRLLQRQPKKRILYYPYVKPVLFPVVKLPQEQWRIKAAQFIDNCHLELMKTPSALNLFHARGFTLGTIERFRLGWNSENLWLNYSDWGLSDFDNKKLWLPRGLVIPTFQSGFPIKLKVRRADHEQPKYIEVSGSMQAPWVYGNISQKPIMVLESELDAILIQQFAGDLCCSMALGGSTKRPDIHSHQLLSSASTILFTCDVDQAGAIAYRWWEKTYPRIKLWVPPISKSPGDAHLQGIDLRKWIEIGLA